MCIRDRIRALENGLFSSAQIEQLLSVKSYEGALRFLTEHGWGDADTPLSAEAVSYTHLDVYKRQLYRIQHGSPRPADDLHYSDGDRSPEPGRAGRSDTSIHLSLIHI